MPGNVLRPETEAAFASWVIDTAHLFHWRVAHFRPARVMRKGVETWETPFSADGKGFPDLVLVHPRKGRPLIVAELKSEKGKLSPEQEEWLRDMAVCPHVWAYVWRPADRARIQAILSGDDVTVGDMAKDLATITHRILTMQSDLEAALKREDTLAMWLVRFLDIAEPAESMAHLNETESLDLLTEEITQALEPYRARAEKKS